MEILCCDKTGTLTIGDVVFEKHVDLRGNDSEYVLQLMYLNSYFEAGVKSPLDDAVLRHEKPDIGSYRKIEEIPFDFERRRLSVVVKKDNDCLLITKGAVENVLEVSTMALLDGRTVPFSDECRRVAEDLYQRLSEEGYRVLAVATRNVPYQPAYHREDEKEMTLIGLAAFMDPPKPDVQAALAQLKSDRIDVLVMTGDNEYVTRKIVRDVGLSTERIIVGADMDAMDDGALVYQAEHGAIFARVSPEQKNRVITALRARGWVVGFLGDGINDAPSMHTADIGISVVNGVDVAKDAANIILLEKDLKVLHDGISEGRRSFANIMKYIIMGTSSNFGNMFSMAAASLFLPFLPMLPTQILLNNLLYDASQISIPSDTVDPDQMRSPKRWRIDFIRQFMLIIGPISSIYDFLTFGLLLVLFHANERLFHTGWFVESLATQTLVVFVIRTTQNPLKSRPATPLLVAVLAVVAISFVLPFTSLGHLLGFTPLPLTLLLAIAVLTVTYLALVQLVKMAFYRRHTML
jgi:Mg2+-importing ATPase